MTQSEFSEKLDQLEKQINAGPAADRKQFQHELHRLVEQVLASGGTVPPRVLDLDVTLTEEAIEAQFDNLPV